MTIKTYAKVAKVIETGTLELNVNIRHQRLVHLDEDNVQKLEKLVDGLKSKVSTVWKESNIANHLTSWL